MSDTVSFAELDGQHVELLAARTVLSMFCTPGPGLPQPGGDLGGFGGLVTQVTGLGATNNGADGSNTDGSPGAGNS